MCVCECVSVCQCECENCVHESGCVSEPGCQGLKEGRPLWLDET